MTHHQRQTSDLNVRLKENFAEQMEEVKNGFMIQLSDMQNEVMEYKLLLDYQ